MLDEKDPSLPLYLKLVGGVKQAIQTQVLQAGEKLPSVKALSDNLQCNRHTVMKAFSELVAQGYISAKERIGYHVADPLPILSSQKGGELPAHDKQVHEYRFVRQGARSAPQQAHKMPFNFAGGQPDLTCFPFAEFKQHFNRVMNHPQISHFSYGESAGVPSLISQIKAYLRKTRSLTGREVVITHGSQEALYIISQLLLTAGDKVAVEKLGYPPAMAAFRSTGAELEGIEQDAQGMLVEDLQRKIAGKRIRLIYLTPLHQYPTTVTLSPARRAAIYQLAAIHGIPIIEDDYDHEFHYRCQPLAPMATQDPKQLVIYMSTFSKIMFAGARIGFLALNKTLAEAVVSYRMLVTHKNNVIMQLALAQWMASGGFERHLRRSTRRYQQRRDNAVDVIQKTGRFEFKVPDGGMAFWLKLKNNELSASKVCRLAAEQGLFIQHQRDFYWQEQDAKLSKNDRHIRLGFAGMSQENFVLGMQKLVGVLHDIESENGEREG